MSQGFTKQLPIEVYCMILTMTISALMKACPLPWPPWSWPSWPPLLLPINEAKAELSPEDNVLVLEEGNVAVLESYNVAYLSQPKTSLNEGRSLLAKICDFISSKILGKLDRK